MKLSSVLIATSTVAVAYANEAATPATPATPAAPATPATPAVPAAPAAPATPADPAAPATPATPATPAVPAAPVDPAAPVAPVVPPTTSNSIPATGSSSSLIVHTTSSSLPVTDSTSSPVLPTTNTHSLPATDSTSSSVLPTTNTNSLPATDSSSSLVLPTTNTNSLPATNSTSSLIGSSSTQQITTLPEIISTSTNGTMSTTSLLTNSTSSTSTQNTNRPTVTPVIPKPLCPKCLADPVTINKLFVTLKVSWSFSVSVTQFTQICVFHLTVLSYQEFKHICAANGFEKLTTDQRKSLAGELNITLQADHHKNTGWDVPADQRQQYSQTTRTTAYTKYLRSGQLVEVKTCELEACKPTTITATADGVVTVPGTVEYVTTFEAMNTDVSSAALADSSTVDGSALSPDAQITGSGDAGMAGNAVSPNDVTSLDESVQTLSTSVLPGSGSNSSSITATEGGANHMALTSIAGLMLAFAALA